MAGFLQSVHHVALARLHVLQGALPLSTTLAVGHEHGKLVLVLDHVARCSLAEVVGQCRRHRQVDQRGVTNAAPACGQGDGAVLHILEGLAPNLHLLCVLHQDGPTDFVRGRGQCETIIKTIMLR